MKKIIKNEQDNETSKKAKRILTSIKVATLAGLITFGSFGLSKNASAEAELTSDFSTEYETDLITDLDDKFTWEFDDGIDRDSIDIPVQVQEEPVTVVETEPVQTPVVVPDEVQTPDVVYEEVQVPETELEEGYIENEEYSGKCLPFLEDVDPAIVDENYTGIAPITYYGPEHVVKNYGDASNDEEVIERATMIWNAFHRANEEAGGLKIVDINTGKEYTIEKLVEIIKYINGAYVAEDGAKAQEINDDWINFMLAFLNDDYLIEDVNYKANSDVIFEEDVKNHTNLLEDVDLGHLLMGDSPNGPFLEWFADKIKAMYTTTDKEEAVRLYDEAYLAIVAITEGNGYIINGVKYTIKDFTDVNDLLLDTEVLISQVLRNNMMEAGYVFNKKYVGEDVVFLTDILEQFNPACSEDLVQYLKDNGVEIYEGVVTHGNGEDLNIRNYASVMQMKAINMAIANGQYGIKYYQDSYLEHYDEYIKEKNGGTYEDVLESDYVYIKR